MGNAVELPVVGGDGLRRHRKRRATVFGAERDARALVGAGGFEAPGCAGAGHEGADRSVEQLRNAAREVGQQVTAIEGIVAGKDSNAVGRGEHHDSACIRIDNPHRL